MFTGASRGISRCAVGLIVNGAQAEVILQQELADVVTVAQEFLRDPYFPLHAAKDLGPFRVSPECGLQSTFCRKRQVELNRMGAN